MRITEHIYILSCRISRAHWVNTWRCIFSVTRKFKGCLHSVFAFCCMLGLYKHTVKVMPFFCRKSWSKIHIILMYYNGACILPLSKLPTVQQHGAESRRHVGCRWSFIHVQLLGGIKHYFFFFFLKNEHIWASKLYMYSIGAAGSCANLFFHSQIYQSGLAFLFLVCTILFNDINAALS